MFSVLTCIFAQHDLRLVVVAALICATACSAAFGFHLRSLKAAGTTMSLAWMALTGLVAGSGVWATHFVAMLAYQPHLSIGYAIGGTVLSLVTAVVGMGLGFALPVLRRGPLAALSGGTLAGSAAAAMHFMGIAAIRTQARFEWDMAFVVASVLVGALGSAAALYLRTRLKGRAEWLAPAVVLVVGIVGLHFTAMTAVTLVPDPTLDFPTDLVGRGALAAATVALTVLIFAAASSLIWMEQVGRRSTLSGLREALDVVPSALSFYDASGRLLSWNRAYARLMEGCGIAVAEGVTRQDFVNAALAAGWRPADGGDYLETRRTPRQGDSAPAVGLRTPDGRWIRHEAFSTPDGGGVTVLTDVTEQQESARMLADARDTAEAANRAKTQFLANMSHEIRTPLNGVLGVADVLAHTELTDKQAELVQVIRASGAMLNNLLGDLLDLARVEAGMEELRPEPACLGDLVRAATRLYVASAEQKGLALHVEIGGAAAGWVACDATRLSQVLGNLVSNAVKFTETGRIDVVVSRHADQVSFQVRDTGAGFDEASKATLFGRFGQADDSSTRKHGGAGLGLAICEHYVRLMGGELNAASVPGQGSVFGFSLTLPALAAPAPVESPMVLAEPDPEAPDPETAGRLRVLVVDDNPVNRQVLGLILDSVGVEHAEAQDGRGGVEATIAGGFDVVLMDIQMPVMDGFEAIRRIRRWEAETAHPRTPIYIVSANCLQEHVDEGAAAGADGHLAKPVSVAQLLAALEPHAAEALAA
jgi:signal transduction histidine kinase/NO-binding membrane sensor protein with MHYT domain/CheY-like chemotaxis protein